MADMDEDGVGNPCDDKDVELDLARASVRNSTQLSRKDGRIRIAGEGVVPAGAPALDGSAGLALRISDGATLDYRMVLAAGDCSTCGSGCARCFNADRSLRLKLRQAGAPAHVRFSARIGGLAIAPPLALRLEVTLTDDPAVSVVGIDWAGVASDCRQDTPGISCR